MYENSCKSKRSCGFLWASYGLPMGFLWASYGLPMGLLWASYGFILVGSYGFLSASCGFLSLAFAHETAAKASILVGSYGLPMGFLWGSYGLQLRRPGNLVSDALPKRTEKLSQIDALRHLFVRIRIKPF